MLFEEVVSFASVLSTLIMIIGGVLAASLGVYIVFVCVGRWDADPVEIIIPAGMGVVGMIVVVVGIPSVLTFIMMGFESLRPASESAVETTTFREQSINWELIWSWLTFLFDIAYYGFAIWMGVKVPGWVWRFWVWFCNPIPQWLCRWLGRPVHPWVYHQLARSKAPEVTQEQVKADPLFTEIDHAIQVADRTLSTHGRVLSLEAYRQALDQGKRRQDASDETPCRGGHEPSRVSCEGHAQNGTTDSRRGDGRKTWGG